jgi:hypothetical protein
MIALGHILSVIGLLLFLIGAGYWVLYLFPSHKTRLAAIRSQNRWHLLGNLTIIGMLVYTAGRALAVIR